MSYPLDDNKTVLEMWQLNIQGNIIPHSWYKTLIKTHTARGEKLKTTRAYLDAIIILADIVWWYRPQEIRNEKTGELIELRKKFKADKLQRSYDQMAELFGMTKDQARNACKYLEEKKLIKLDFRHSKIASNQLFIDLNIDHLRKFTYIIPVNLQGSTRKFTHTYTETTPENTTETTFNLNEELAKVNVAYERLSGNLITPIKSDKFSGMLEDWADRLKRISSDHTDHEYSPSDAVIGVLEYSAEQEPADIYKYSQVVFAHWVKKGYGHNPFEKKPHKPTTPQEKAVEGLKSLAETEKELN